MLGTSMLLFTALLQIGLVQNTCTQSPTQSWSLRLLSPSLQPPQRTHLEGLFFTEAGTYGVAIISA